MHGDAPIGASFFLYYMDDFTEKALSLPLIIIV